MTELVAHGIEVTLPSGWEGRLFRRPSAGEFSAAAADGPPAPAGETTHAVLHVSTIALPIGVGDFASGAVEKLGDEDALIVLFEYDPASADQPLFRAEGIPKQLQPDEFSPGVLQRAIRGQAGAQVFFHDSGRAFCLYVVLGSFANRRNLVPAVNQVLTTLTIEQLDAAGQPVPSSTTTSPSTTTPAPTTTEPPVTEPEPTTTTAAPEVQP
jgi:hypothetical protein